MGGVWGGWVVLGWFLFGWWLRGYGVVLGVCRVYGADATTHLFKISRMDAADRHALDRYKTERVSAEEDACGGLGGFWGRFPWVGLGVAWVVFGVGVQLS